MARSHSMIWKTPASALARWLRGRRVLTATPYMLPKDGGESLRLDLQHYTLFALGTQVHAPVDFRRPQRMLDVACGTGLWARELVAAHKAAQAIGLDIDVSPLQIAQAKLGRRGLWPRTFRYVVADASGRLDVDQAAGWADTFSYTHSRMIAPFVRAELWPSVVSELVRVTRPGGWVECVETTLPTSASPLYQKITAAVGKLVAGRGLIMDAGPLLKGWMGRAGLVNVHTETVILGAGGIETARLPNQHEWFGENKLQRLEEEIKVPGEGGEGLSLVQPLIIENAVRAFAALRHVLIPAGFCTDEEFTAMQREMPLELAQYGISWKVDVAWGRKPRPDGNQSRR